MHIRYAYLCLDKHEALLEDYLPRFPDAYRQKIRQFKNQEDAQRSLAGRILLYQAMQDIYGMDCQKTEISYNAYGKPYFGQKPVQFNISHSGDIVVCALTTGMEIGIDIELVQPLDPLDFKGQMTDNEWQYIVTAPDRLTAFYDYWTQKEAVIKAQGRGLSTPLTHFEIANNAAMLGGQVFYLEGLPVDTLYKCHIAGTNPINQYSLNNIIL